MNTVVKKIGGNVHSVFVYGVAKKEFKSSDTVTLMNSPKRLTAIAKAKKEFKKNEQIVRSSIEDGTYNMFENGDDAGGIVIVADAMAVENIQASGWRPVSRASTQAVGSRQ